MGAHLGKPKDAPLLAAAPSPPRNPLVAAIRTLPPEHQAVWRDQNPEYARTYGPKVREARALVRETMRSFGAEPFDADTALTNLARARDLEHESRVAMDRRLVAFAATLPRPERAALGDALARPRLGRNGNGGRPALADR